MNEELKEYWSGFPEAPASDTFKWTDKDGFDHMTTVRAWSGASLIQQIDRAKQVIVEAGGTPPIDAMVKRAISAQPPNPDPAAKIAMQEGNKEMAQELQAQAEAVPPPPSGKEWQTYDADVVKVLPQPDNRVTIEFWGSGRKYPDMKVVKWKLESANGLMKHVTSEPMDKAAEYKLHCRVYYTNGKEFEPGKFYKDVAHVRPI